MFALLSDVYLAQHEAAEAADVATVASALALVTTLERIVPDVLDAADDGACWPYPWPCPCPLP